MANGKIRFGKQSGGELALVIPDGVDNTEVIVPESGVLATQAYADGKTTLAQVKAEISTGSNLVTSPAGAVGYGTGSGGVVTQLTNKNFNVSLNKPTGTITTSNSALMAGQGTNFIFLNTLISIYDNLKITPRGTINYDVDVIDIYNGAAAIRIINRDSISRSDVISINFNVIKGANS